MKKLYVMYCNLSKRVRDSIIISASIVGFISTLLSILGISLGDCEKISVSIGIIIVVAVFVIFYILTFATIGRIFKESVSTTINMTPVSIHYGNIFDAQGLKVIGCDTHFDTRVDDIVISKNSLHGQLVLEHGNKDEIQALVEKEANRLGIEKNSQGLYDFPLGTIIRYDSSVDNQTYLLLAMTELNSQFEAHTNMAKFEHMLMKMWKEIDRVYASNDIALPILGGGIARFDDGPKEMNMLLKCMLCTFNSSSIRFNSNVEIYIFKNDNDEKIPLYEYKDIFKLSQWR